MRSASTKAADAATALLGAASLAGMVLHAPPRAGCLAGGEARGKCSMGGSRGAELGARHEVVQRAAMRAAVEAAQRFSGGGAPGRRAWSARSHKRRRRGRGSRKPAPAEPKVRWSFTPPRHRRCRASATTLAMPNPKRLLFTSACVGSLLARFRCPLPPPPPTALLESCIDVTRCPICLDEFEDPPVASSSSSSSSATPSEGVVRLECCLNLFHTACIFMHEAAAAVSTSLCCPVCRDTKFLPRQLRQLRRNARGVSPSGSPRDAAARDVGQGDGSAGTGSSVKTAQRSAASEQRVDVARPQAEDGVNAGSQGGDPSASAAADAAPTAPGDGVQGGEDRAVAGLGGVVASGPRVGRVPARTALRRKKRRKSQIGQKARKARQRTGAWAALSCVSSLPRAHGSFAFSVGSWVGRPPSWSAWLRSRVELSTCAVASFGSRHVVRPALVSHVEVVP